MAQGAGVLASRALRGGRWSLIGLALVVALGGGAATGAAVAAHRTDHAYGDYVDDAQVAELVINPSIRTAAMDEAIRVFDGVEDVRVDSLMFASTTVTEATTIEEAGTENQWLQVRGSVDGRFIDVDRPAVTEGRVPSGEREVFVSNEYRDELERLEGRSLEVGDTLEMGFFWGGIFESEPAPDTVITPLGVESLRISGFGVLPNEVLPEELFPGEQLIVSEDVTARYYCLDDIDPAASLEEAFAAALPEDCSAQYDYYSMQVPGGAAGVRSVRQQFEAVSAELTDELPASLTELGFGYYYISQERSELDDAVGETIRPTVIALQVFALVAAIVTLTVAGLMVARQTRRQVDAQRSLRAIGTTRAELAAWSATPPVLAVLVGTLGALVVAYAVSPVGPIGTVRPLAPTGASLPAEVALPVAGGLGLIVILVILAVLVRATVRAVRTDVGASRASGRLTAAIRRGRPSMTTGIGAALDARRAGAGIAAMVGCVVATAAAAAAIVFGASLSRLVDDPESYGWPWDVAVLTGAGYGDTAADVVDERLEQGDVRDDIVDHSFYGFDPSPLFGDRPAPVIFGFPNAFDTSFPVLEGRMPLRAGEAVLGVDTSASLDLGVGDQVTVQSTEFGEIHVDIVGLSVLPSLGPFIADHTGLGTGAFILVDTDPAPDTSASLTGIRLRDGADAEEVVERLEPDLASFSDLFELPVTHTDPVRSPEIQNVSELRLAPLLLGGTLLAALALGLWLAITLSVRDRRRELAILRALGFSNRDAQRSVRWQGLTLVAVGLVLGIPLGVVGGRIAWRAFADNLGVPGTATVPLTWLLAEVAVTVALGWLAVALPARTAARLAPAEELQVP